MRKFYFLFTLFFFAIGIASTAQNVAINNNSALPDSSAMLDIQSITKGLLIPRMTDTQRLALKNPASGLLVYQVNGANGFYFNAGSPSAPKWVLIAADNEPPSVKAGNDTTIIVDDSNNSTRLTGTATDKDGSVVAYLWSQVSGPTLATINTPGSPSTIVNSLSSGTYVFQLMALDNKGAMGVKSVSVLTTDSAAIVSSTAKLLTNKTWLYTEFFSDYTNPSAELSYKRDKESNNPINLSAARVSFDSNGNYTEIAPDGSTIEGMWKLIDNGTKLRTVYNGGSNTSEIIQLDSTGFKWFDAANNTYGKMSDSPYSPGYSVDFTKLTGKTWVYYEYFSNYVTTQSALVYKKERVSNALDLTLNKVVFNADGTFNEINENGQAFVGTWQIINGNQVQTTINFRSTVAEVISLDNNNFIWKNANGNTYGKMVLKTTTVPETVQLHRGLVSYFNFNNNIDDSSGNNNHGTLIQGASLSTDQHGNVASALDCNGDGQLLLVNNNGKINFDSTLSVSFDVMVRNSKRSTFITMVEYNTAYAANFGMGTVIPGNSTIITSIVDKDGPCDTLRNNDQTYSLDSRFTPQENEWYNVICTFNKGSVKLFINGQLMETGQSKNNTILNCPNAQLLIGGWWQQDPAASIDGKMDNVRLYDRQLNQAEIDELAKDFKHL